MPNQSIADKIAEADAERQRIASNIEVAYNVARSKGATMPQAQNSANLAATINSIPTGSTPTLITKQITENGTYTAARDNADGYSEVEVNVPKPSVDLSKPVEFIDYDGTILHTYTRAEALALTALPEAGQHEGLTFRSWNWSLQGIKDYLAHHSFVIVGAVYTSSDGQNHDIWDNPLFEGTTNLVSEQRLSSFSGSRSGYGFLKRINIPNGTTKLDSYSFYECFNLEAIVIPNNCEVLGQAFQGCTALKKISLPETLIQSSGAYSLNRFVQSTSIDKISIPDSITKIYDMPFHGCKLIRHIEFPKNLTGSIQLNAGSGSDVIETLIIPSGIGELPSLAIYLMRSLHTIVVLGKPIMTSSDSIGVLYANYKVYVHKSDMDWYSTATNWSAVYEDHIEAIEDNIEQLNSVGIDISIYL